MEPRSVFGPDAKFWEIPLPPLCVANIASTFSCRCWYVTLWLVANIAFYQVDTAAGYLHVLLACC